MDIEKAAYNLYNEFRYEWWYSTIGINKPINDTITLYVIKKTKELEEKLGTLYEGYNLKIVETGGVITC